MKFGSPGNRHQDRKARKLIWPIDVLDYIGWFLHVELALDPWDKAHVIMVNSCFNMSLGSFCYRFVEDLRIYS